MPHQRAVVAAVVLSFVLVSGCIGSPAGRMAGAEIGVEDDQTSIDVNDNQATWTWKGDLNPSRGEEPCDVTITVTVYNANGTELASKTTVLRDVYADQQLRSVTIIDEPEVIDSIATYDVDVESKQCRE